MFKGNALVDISPRPGRPAWPKMVTDDGYTLPVNKGYPIYEREVYKAKVAPTRTVERYVAPRLI